MEIEKFLSEWIGNRSEESWAAYRADLNTFARFLEELSLSVESVDPCHIKEYVKHLEGKWNFMTKSNGVSDGTIQRHLSSIRSYYRWLQYYNPGQRNPTAVYKFRRSKEPREVLPVSPDLSKAMCNGWACKRDIAIVQTFRFSGIRLRELVRMNKDCITVEINNIDGVDHTCGVASVLGKGRKTRKILIHQIALEAIMAYLEDRGQDTEPALFVTSIRTRTSRVSRRTVQRVIRSMALNAAAVHVHPHQLRHSFGTEMRDAGMDERVLQKLMGHKHLKTTLKYTHVDEVTIAQQYFAAMELIDAENNEPATE